VGFPVDETAHWFKSTDMVHQQLDVRALLCGQSFRFLSQLTVYYYYYVFFRLTVVMHWFRSHYFSFMSPVSGGMTRIAA